MTVGTFLLLVFVGLILIANYLFIHHNRFKNLDLPYPIPKKMLTNFMTPSYQMLSNFMMPTYQMCCNPLFCPMQGKWVLRNDMSYIDFNDVLNTNIELRTRKGLPKVLTRNDLRCGRKNPLSRTLVYNKTLGLYPDIASQCDGFSETPCCNDDFGWCGNGQLFCSCEKCIDYSRIIYAELYTWIHANRCQYFNFDKNQSCTYFKNQFSSTTFIGDSLVRHVFSSLLLSLTGDLLFGALKVTLTQSDLRFCSGENQFIDSSCHVKLATKWSEIQQNKMYCPSLISKPELSFVQAYSTLQSQMALETIKLKLSEPRPLFIVGIGIHDNFNAEKVIQYYLDPIVQLIRQASNSKPILVWLNSHSAGLLKPLSFQMTQGNEQIQKFNEELYKYCFQNSIIVFDTFNITKGVHSFDGTHYGSALNQLKVNLLINGLLAVTNHEY
nr:uncharacterized protein LOC105846371 [Hydra vulgaris]